MNFDYDLAWKEIDSLEAEGLLKSALEKTQLLLAHAKNEQNAPQSIKALMYSGKYMGQLEENGVMRAFKMIEEEMLAAKFPEKAILQSILAEMYSKYLDNNYWILQDRTSISGGAGDDIQTWSADKFIRQSAGLYLASLEYEKLKTTPISEFQILLTKGQKDEGLRPTLYDFLAHRSLDFFMNERNYLPQPAYKFYIQDKKAFGPADEFINWSVMTSDSSSLKYQSLLLFQDLISFRNESGNNESAAFLDADLKRLRFVYDNAVIENKDSFYLEALAQLREKYSQSPLNSEVIFQTARTYYHLGMDYRPFPSGVAGVDEAKKWHWKKAFDLCTEAIEKYPGSFGASECEMLKTEILQKSINIETAQVSLPDEPILAKVEYRNLPEVWLKVIRFDKDRRETFEKLATQRNADEQIIAFFNRLPAVRSSSVKLPDDGDYRTHSVEVKIDKLPIGQYVILVSGQNNFNIKETAISYLFTHISEIGYWQRQNNGGGSQFVVFHRASGQPLKGVKAELFSHRYNSVFRKSEWKKTGSEVSDESGFIIPKPATIDERNFRVLFCYNKDSLFLDDYFYNYRYPTENRRFQQTNFFLDRAIYRPGQVVYFKGIALEYDENRLPKILKNDKVTVTLRDANYQEASKLELKSNDYGTFSGQFTAPRSGLLGQMSLASSIGGQSQYFRVEEYKRPKFEVKMLPVEEGYRLNDTITLTGIAQAYAGNNIDGAQVNWRVVREVRFPWMPWWFARWYPWKGETMEIANGKSLTDAEGKFEIKFAALPDLSIPKAQKPEFSFSIYADVTDITGETQSTESTVKAAYISMNLDASVSQRMNIDSLRKITILSENLNGQFVPAKGTLIIEQLRTPENLFLHRYWEKPDKTVLSEKEFKMNFPMIAWQNEDIPESWPVSRKVTEGDFDTAKSKEWDLSKTNLRPGWYVLTMRSKDRYGESVEVKKYFSLFDMKANSLPAPEMAVHFKNKVQFEPGETAQLYFGSSEKNQPILLEIEKEGKTITRSWINVSGMKTSDYLVKEEDRGNVHYTYSYGKYNRSFNLSETINVPWSNKELTIEYGTFRDKLQPGQEEEWQIKIKGPKGEKLAAEMVAGMYDASLDAFAPNNWGLNIFPFSWARVSYRAGGYQITSKNDLSFFPPINTGQPVRRVYQMLNWFNWYLDGFAGGDIVEMRAMAAAPLAEIAMSEEEPSMPAKKMMNGKEDTDSAGQDRENAIQSPKPDDGAQILQVRTNLDETVFFYPNLMTDAEGNILIRFKMNEALTKWKFLGFAHTTDLKIGSSQKEVVTQKELMVIPNPPRFFREHDEIEYTAKVVNLTDKTLSGNAQLQLVNPFDAMPVFKWEDNPLFNQNFTVEPRQSARLAWRFKIPDAGEVPLIEHTVVAHAGDFSDAERSAAPVLSNRLLVTETMPMFLKGGQRKDFVFKPLIENDSKTLKHQGFTLEFTQNPAWYAVQALPYLMDYPYECTEQIFARYYANTLAASVANSHPKIKSVFEKWRNYQPDALTSNLQKNQELKTALLEETPWVLNAQSEEQQKQNIALLFDLNKMSYEREAAMTKLQERQLPGGGWPWFPGDRDNWYITQYITEGLGHLDKLGAIDLSANENNRRMVQEAIRYCDNRLVEHFEKLEQMVKEGKAKWEDDHLGYLEAHYLYTRSFFLENKSTTAETSKSTPGKDLLYFPLEGKASQAHDYYLGQAEKHWLNKGYYTEGLLSLALHRNGKATSANKIVRSLKERSLSNEELGTYWKYPKGYWWYTAPIETQALMIEVFSEDGNDPAMVDGLKVWLLKNKQTNHWNTTKATASAVYALLMNGDSWLMEDTPLSISFNNNPKADLWTSGVQRSQNSPEAGTGYFKVKFDGGMVEKEMGKISVHNPNQVIAWGGAYWQYLEQLDKIKNFEETPLTLKKQLFKVSLTDKGETLLAISDKEPLRVGEKLKVRIELRVDRDMEYVHMKDMRASGFEPLNVFSEYKWQGGLGYYESTRDASTNFFFSWLPKGTYVFEYPLRVVHKGDFSNGITTLQCMYAPEFSSHSEGIRVKVE